MTYLQSLGPWWGALHLLVLAALIWVSGYALGRERGERAGERRGLAQGYHDAISDHVHARLRAEATLASAPPTIIAGARPRLVASDGDTAA